MIASVRHYSANQIRVPRVAIRDLEAGDRIELRCRHWQGTADQPAGFVERWIVGVVIHSDEDSWPLVKLADEQITELRPFMNWRVRGSGPHL